MTEQDEHRPTIVYFGSRHMIPAEVCWGCSDERTGRWVPVVWCAVAKATMDDPAAEPAVVHLPDGNEPAGGQRRTTCTVDDVQAWVRGIVRYEEILSPSSLPTRVRIGDQEYPPCLGCGGKVHVHPEGALIVSEHLGGAVTFHPCGCILTLVERQPIQPV
jgi:hypothetical protein